jgi:hypothetical protein
MKESHGMATPARYSATGRGHACVRKLHTPQTLLFKHSGVSGTSSGQREAPCKDYFIKRFTTQKVDNSRMGGLIEIR